MGDEIVYDKQRDRRFDPHAPSRPPRPAYVEKGYTFFFSWIFCCCSKIFRESARGGGRGE